MKKTFVVAAAITGISAMAAAQQPAVETARPGMYVGVASCANSGCHGSTHPLKETRVLQNEYYTWLNRGRHSRAYNVLFNDRSARIAKNMRISGPANQASLCLDCHSTNVPAAQVSGHIDREDGVQCEACHGPASGWRDEHTQPGWTHAQSVERGMRDLRDLQVRASNCMSCHVGDSTREVDHELIASGHPQLAFELDNYSESMPAHWNPNDTHGVRAWAAGQLVAFENATDNLARHARGSKWPEFSDMSCYDCHHALKSSGWRQERGWSGRAGQPAWSGQRWAVLRLIIDRVSPDARAQLDPLVAAMNAKVGAMNDPAGVASTADDAHRIAASIAPTVASRQWSDADVRSMIATIAASGDSLARADVHSAEQTALSLQSLAAVLTRRDPSLAGSPLMKSIDDLFAEVRNRDEFDPRRFAEKLANVR